jgi:hypothetical protein
MPILLAGLLVVAACGSDATTSPASASIAGTYQLRAINGSALPFTYQSGTTKVIVTADALTVADGGTWSEQASFTLTVNGSTSAQVVSDGGTWTRAGTSVSFFSTQSSTTSYSGTFTGNGFTLGDTQFTYTFSK